MFIRSLVDAYTKTFNDCPSDLRKRIIRWVLKGDSTVYIDKLLDPVTNRHIPIWWSGFNMKDSVDNPKKYMQEAARRLNGYSSIDTHFTKHTRKEQDIFLESCSPIYKNKFMISFSHTYTINALKNTPHDIALFVNKTQIQFKKSFFMRVEFPIICGHYSTHKKPVVMHIFNVRDNSKELINAMRKTCDTQLLRFNTVENCSRLKCVMHLRSRKTSRRRSHRRKATRF